MSMNRHVILNYVDTPLKILFWTVPELLMLIMPCFIGLLISQLTAGLLTSLFYFWLTKVYQRHFGKGQLHAVMYWLLPANKRFKQLPHSFIREYVG
jgi:type IV conjugative transfer system protein TraL